MWYEGIDYILYIVKIYTNILRNRLFSIYCVDHKTRVFWVTDLGYQLKGNVDKVNGIEDSSRNKFYFPFKNYSCIEVYWQVYLNTIQRYWGILSKSEYKIWCISMGYVLHWKFVQLILKNKSVPCYGSVVKLTPKQNPIQCFLNPVVIWGTASTRMTLRWFQCLIVHLLQKFGLNHKKYRYLVCYISFI